MHPRIKKIVDKIRIIEIKNFYSRYESHIGFITIIAGFILDNISLRDASITTQTYVFITYLVISGASIMLLSLLERKGEGSSSYPKLHFWTFLLFQFSIGSLFSTFFVFYSRGISLETSWPFLVLLFSNLIATELFKKFYLKVSVQLSIYFVTIFSFCIYSLPVVTHTMSGEVFFLSGLLSLLLITLFVFCIRSVLPREVFKKEKWHIILGIALVYVAVNILYTTNTIPPVPLVMKQGGVYHSLVWDGKNYRVTKETRPIVDLSLYPNFHHTYNAPVYVISSIYAPGGLTTSVVHDWQYYNEKNNSWISITKVNVKIFGGRENGYRIYSLKKNVFPGLWRVDIVTTDKKIVGRIKFRLTDSYLVPNLEQEIY